MLVNALLMFFSLLYGTLSKKRTALQHTRVFVSVCCAKLFGIFKYQISLKKRKKEKRLCCYILDSGICPHPDHLMDRVTISLEIGEGFMH